MFAPMCHYCDVRQPTPINITTTRNKVYLSTCSYVVPAITTDFSVFYTHAFSLSALYGFEMGVHFEKLFPHISAFVFLQTDDK